MSRIAKRQDRQDGFSLLPLCDPAHPVLSFIEYLYYSHKLLVHLGRVKAPAAYRYPQVLAIRRKFHQRRGASRKDETQRTQRGNFIKIPPLRLIFARSASALMKLPSNSHESIQTCE
jgi:hypothetical protein